MEVRSAVWLLAALLLDLISAQDQNSLKYQDFDKKLVLRPEPGLFSGSIRSMSWKLNGSLVAVLDEGQPLVYNPVFGDRVKVDKTTGVLEIRNTMKNESGEYTVSINNKIQDGGYEVKLIKQVPKPVVNLTCTQQLENCSLTCDGDVTEAGPVTFYFKKGDFLWEKGEQNIKIMNDEDTQAVKTFSCGIKNPLGQKDSEPVDNLFYVKSNTVKIMGSVVVLLIAAVAPGVVLCSA